jgi:hypothetical protein
VRPLQKSLSLPPPAAVRERAIFDQCCSGDLGYLLSQINVICLLLFLIGTTAIVKHPEWFGSAPEPPNCSLRGSHVRAV